jgi:hypothetical protein
VYRILAEHDEVPSCHRLHYLQMVCEKLAKHSGFSKFIGPFFMALKEDYSGKDAQLRGLIT